VHVGIEITNLGDYTEPRVAVRLAQAAEEAGSEGLFVWDCLAFTWDVPSGDPWVILSAVANQCKARTLAVINLDHANRSFSSSLTLLRMLCCCQVEAKMPIPLSRAPGMGRASGATGYRFSAVAGLLFWGKRERERTL
jgi:hypothetical protein